MVRQFEVLQYEHPHRRGAAGHYTARPALCPLCRRASQGSRRAMAGRLDSRPHLLPAREGVQAVKRWIATVGVITAMLTPAVLAGPASAAPAPITFKCISGDNCVTMLRQLVQFSGDYAAGTNNTVVDITPPPCLWKPIGDATTGSQYVINFSAGVDPGPAGLFQTGASFAQAKMLLKQTPKPAGEWYELPVNPQASAAAQKECLKLPLFFWAVQTAQLPGLNIPPRTLAQLAFAGVKTPKAGTPQLNPV